MDSLLAAAVSVSQAHDKEELINTVEVTTEEGPVGFESNSSNGNSAREQMEVVEKVLEQNQNDMNVQQHHYQQTPSDNYMQFEPVSDAEEEIEVLSVYPPHRAVCSSSTTSGQLPQPASIEERSQHITLMRPITNYGSTTCYNSALGAYNGYNDFQRNYSSNLGPETYPMMTNHNHTQTSVTPMTVPSDNQAVIPSGNQAVIPSAQAVIPSANQAVIPIPSGKQAVFVIPSGNQTLIPNLQLLPLQPAARASLPKPTTFTIIERMHPHQTLQANSMPMPVLFPASFSSMGAPAPYMGANSVGPTPFPSTATNNMLQDRESSALEVSTTKQAGLAAGNHGKEDVSVEMESLQLSSCESENEQVSTAATTTNRYGDGSLTSTHQHVVQNGLCRICLLLKENLSSIFENVTVNANGTIGNARGSGASRQFNLVTALKDLLGIEVQVNDGLPAKICMECYDEVMNFSAYRMRVTISQTRLNALLNEAKRTQVTTFISSVGEIDIQRTNVYRNTTSIVLAKNIFKNSRHSFLVLRNLSDRTLDKIFSSLNLIFGFASDKLKSLQFYACESPFVVGIFCSICHVIVHGSKDDYAEHCKMLHGVESLEDVVYPCDICGNNFHLRAKSESQQSYCEHWYQHFYMYGCNVCSKKLPSPKGLLCHKKSAHGNKKQFICYNKECDKSFSTKSKLDKHLRTHINAGFGGKDVDHTISSTVCDQGQSPRLRRTRASAVSMKGENTHTVSNQSATWNCNVCELQFENEPSLASHRLSVHKKMGFKCGICGRSFDSALSRNSHMLAHKDKRCKLCPKQFSTVEALKRHTKNHKKQKKGNQSYICTVCGKVYKVLRSLRNHERTHQGENREISNVCSLCGERFETNSLLRAHFKLHDTTHYN